MSYSKVPVVAVALAVAVVVVSDDAASERKLLEKLATAGSLHSGMAWFRKLHRTSVHRWPSHSTQCTVATVATAVGAACGATHVDGATPSMPCSLLRPSTLLMRASKEVARREGGGRERERTVKC